MAISSEYSPLNMHSSHYCDVAALRHRRHTRTSLTYHLAILAISIASVASLFFNLYLYREVSKQQLASGRPSYSGIPYNMPVIYHARTNYSGEDENLANELWDSIDTSPIAVALEHRWAVDHGLPNAGLFPWDESKGTYFIKGLHQIHCLKLMRRMTIDYRNGHKPLTEWSHYEHCLDALRKDIMCYADDTPMPGYPDRHLGDGQVLQCRNWAKLIAWTQEPERQACYRSLGDYREVKHTLERFAFCPLDSPYADVQRAYFQQFGHKDVYEDV